MATLQCVWGRPHKEQVPSMFVNTCAYIQDISLQGHREHTICSQRSTIPVSRHVSSCYRTCPLLAGVVLLDACPRFGEQLVTIVTLLLGGQWSEQNQLAGSVTMRQHLRCVLTSLVQTPAGSFLDMDYLIAACFSARFTWPYVCDHTWCVWHTCMRVEKSINILRKILEWQTTQLEKKYCQNWKGLLQSRSTQTWLGCQHSISISKCRLFHPSSSTVPGEEASGPWAEAVVVAVLEP